MKALAHLIEAISAKSVEFVETSTLPVALPRRARTDQVLTWVSAYLVDHPDDALGLYLYQVRGDLPSALMPITRTSFVHALYSRALEPVVPPDVLAVLRADVTPALGRRQLDELLRAAEFDLAIPLNRVLAGLGSAGAGRLAGQSSYVLYEYRCPLCGHTVRMASLDGLRPKCEREDHPSREMERVSP